MRRVIKIGGSLLSNPDVVPALLSWIESQPRALNVAIVGGGELIDAMRGLDARFHCEPAWMHWECVRLLRISFQILSSQLEGWTAIDDASAFQKFAASPSATGDCLLAVDSFYRAGCDAPLPEDWRTTTDAIAGWLAMLLDADELVLLKSCDVDPAESLQSLANRGVVDEAIQPLARSLPPVRLVNLAEV